MKHTAVVFTHNNARVIVADDAKKLDTYENVVLNADLSYVKGIPPHFWKYENGFILPMSESEQKARMENIVRSGTQNDVHSRVLAVLEKKRQEEEAETLRLTKEREDAHLAHMEDYVALKKAFTDHQKKTMAQNDGLISSQNAFFIEVARVEKVNLRAESRITKWLACTVALILFHSALITYFLIRR